MMPLYDMLANAQNGQGMEALARQFGLSMQQTQAAVEALLPAFSEGLKRNTADPYGIGAFMQAMAGGQHARYFENPAAAFSPQGLAEGNGVLGQLFGSKDLSRAVASQAAQATGIGESILKQMLPAIAAMIMGGLFKQSTSQAQSGSNPFGELLGRMMGQAGGGFGFPGMPGAQPQSTQPAGDPFDNPFGKALRDMFGGRQAEPQPQAPPSEPFGGNPWGRVFEDMLGGGRRPAPQPSPAPRGNPSGRPRNPYDDLFGQMFETGRQSRDEYQKSMESIFDTMLKGMERRR